MNKSNLVDQYAHSDIRYPIDRREMAIEHLLLG